MSAELAAVRASLEALRVRAEAGVAELPDGVRADARALVAELPAVLAAEWAGVRADLPAAVEARIVLRGFVERLARREAEGIGYATLARAASAFLHGRPGDAAALAREADAGLARLGL